jgi:quercetin dioxygenase-like cupin family protein
MRLERVPWTEAAAPSEDALRARLTADGFEAFAWSDAPGADYTAHAHDHDESLWVVDGEITFGVGARAYRLGSGDRLMLPGGTVHTAHVGPEGARYLIGRRVAR